MPGQGGLEPHDALVHEGDNTFSHGLILPHLSCGGLGANLP